MKRHLLTATGLVFMLGWLTACAPVAPVAVIYPVPPLPPPVPVAVVPLPAEVVEVPVVRHHHAAVRPAHPVHRHVVRKTTVVRTTRWSPYCGSVVHPCDVEHVDVPIH